MRFPGSALAVGVLVLIVAGCATGSPGGSAPAGSAAAGDDGGASVGAASGASEGPLVWLPDWAGDVPERVADRRPLPFCGVERAPQPQPGIFIDRAIRLCFWNAHLAGTEAEFVSLQTTIEGAPIATIYRLAPDGTVEVFTDFTQDAFGGGAWQASSCARVVEGEGNELLGVADCGEGVTLE